MLIIPAIDLLDGKVVRLSQGRKESAKIYSDNPVATALKWIECGAKTLHIVDLNASFEEGDNLKVIKEMVKLKVELEAGGGIRTFERAEQLLEMGVQRLILGTKAMDEHFLTLFLEKFRESTCVSVDVLDNRLRTYGWRRQTEVNFLEFIKFLIDKGVKWIVYTDILKDGTLKGPNIENIKKLATLAGPNYIISGGISSLADLRLINKEAPFIYGVILGRALYEGRIDLKEAFALFATR